MATDEEIERELIRAWERQQIRDLRPPPRSRWPIAEIPLREEWPRVTYEVRLPGEGAE